MLPRAGYIFPRCILPYKKLGKSRYRIYIIVDLVFKFACNVRVSSTCVWIHNTRVTHILRAEVRGYLARSHHPRMEWNNLDINPQRRASSRARTYRPPSQNRYPPYFRNNASDLSDNDVSLESISDIRLNRVEHVRVQFLDHRSLPYSLASFYSANILSAERPTSRIRSLRTMEESIIPTGEQWHIHQLIPLQHLFLPWLNGVAPKTVAFRTAQKTSWKQRSSK